MNKPVQCCSIANVDASDGYYRTWMKIYDDEGLTIKIEAPHSIRVYQAGSFGCIIQKL